MLQVKFEGSAKTFVDELSLATDLWINFISNIDGREDFGQSKWDGMAKIVVEIETNGEALKNLDTLEISKMMKGLV